jgi:cytoskeletal protein RodZ
MQRNIVSVDLFQIGQYLRTEREEKGISEDKVAGLLCVRKAIVKAIESGNWYGLPHEVYVKGYIRDYAKLLMVDDAVEPYLVTQENNEVSDSSADNTPKPGYMRSSRVLLLCPLVVFLIAAFFLLEIKERRDLAASRFEHARYVSRSHYSAASNVNVPQLRQGKQLTITCRERTWVSVVIDGSERKEFLLSPQDVVVLNGQEQFTLLVGNAGGVKIFLDGKDTLFTGARDEVKHLTLP